MLFSLLQPRMFMRSIIRRVTIGWSDPGEMNLASPFFRTQDGELFIAKRARVEWMAWFVAVIALGITLLVRTKLVWECFGLSLTWSAWLYWRVWWGQPIVHVGQLSSVKERRSLWLFTFLACATILMTGGWTSPATWLLGVLVLQQRSKPRHVRMLSMLIMGAAACVATPGVLRTLQNQTFPLLSPPSELLSSHPITKWLDDLQFFPWEQVTQSLWLISLLMLLPLFALVQSLYGTERIRPPFTALMRHGFSSFGYDPNHERLYMSLLVRAMKLYAADAGMIVSARRGESAKTFYAIRHLLNWKSSHGLPLVKPRSGADIQLTLSSGEASESLAWLHPYLEEAKVDRTSRFRLKRASSVYASCMVFRIGPQLDAVDQVFFVLASKGQRSAFLSPITWANGAFWSQALQSMETAMHEAALRRVLQAAKSFEELRTALREECAKFAPVALRPFKVVVASRRKRDPVIYMRYDSQHKSTGADRLISACTVHLGVTEALDTADVCVLVESPGILLRVNPEVLARTRTLINEFLADVFRVPAAVQLLRGPKVKESERGWVLLEFNSEIEDKLRGLKRLPSSPADYDQIFKNFGFSVLQTNPIMEAWMPWLKKEAVGVCYQAYKLGERQSSACRQCPIILRLHEDLHRAVSQNTPAPAPATVGSRKITKHFFLSCELLRDPIHDNQIRGIIEHVEDRTVDFEKRRLFRFLQSSEAAKCLQTEHRPIYQRLAEGLGRIFHAEFVLVFSRGMRDMDKEYFTSTYTPDERALADAKAGQVIYEFQRKKSPTDSTAPDESWLCYEQKALRQLRETVSERQYVEKMEALLPPLYEEKTVADKILPDEVLKQVNALLAESRELMAAGEHVSESSNNEDVLLHFFDRDLVHGGIRRVLAVNIPFSNAAILIGTGMPADWEYQAWDRNSGRLRADRAELKAAYDMVEGVGGLLKGRGLISKEDYLRLVAEVRGHLMHELNHTSDVLEFHAKRLNFISSENMLEFYLLIQQLHEQSLLEAGQSHKGQQIESLPVWGWLRCMEEAAKKTVRLEPGDVERAVTRIAMLLDVNRDQVSIAFKEVVSRVGEAPPEFFKLKALTESQRGRFLSWLRQYMFTREAVSGFVGLQTYIHQIRDNTWTPKTHQNYQVSDIIQSLIDSSKLAPGVQIVNHLDHQLKTNLNRLLLTPIFANLLRNAVQAANTFKSQSAQIARIHVHCRAHPDLPEWPYFFVANDGLEMPPNVQAELFLITPVHAATTLGDPGTGTGIAMASQYASILGGWLRYDYARLLGSSTPMHVFMFLPIDYPNPALPS